MTKDFKDKKNIDAPLNDIVSWILAGIALGLFIALMIYLFSDKFSQATEPSNAKSNNPVQANSITTPQVQLSPEEKRRQERLDKMVELDRLVEDNLNKAEDDPRPTFNYHVILPTLDVEVPVARPPEWNDRKTSSTSHHKKTENPKTSNTKSNKAQTNKNIRYIIQVGSYRKKIEAERMKNKVSSLGTTYIETATVKGATWYRVRIGPIADTNKVNKIKSTLSAQGIAFFKKTVN